MLSAHFWMGTGVTLGAAAVMGLSLGQYVTSPQAPAHAVSATIDTAIDPDGVAEVHATAEKGPSAIHCTGCGPTLAERRWKADMAGLEDAATIDTAYDAPVDDYATVSAVELPSPVDRQQPPVVRSVSEDRVSSVAMDETACVKTSSLPTKAILCEGKAARID